MPPPLRLLILNYEYPPLGGGAGHATACLVNEFSHDPDIEIMIVAASPGAQSVERIHANTTLHRLDIGKQGNIYHQSNLDLLRYLWRTYAYTRKLIRHQSFDLCHAFFGIPCGLIAMWLGMPYIVSLRGSDVPFHNRRFKFIDTILFRRLSRSIWARAHAVVSNSLGLRNLALRSAPLQSIAVIPNGVDTHMFQPHHHNSPILRVLSVARLTAHKRLDCLIRAVAALRDEPIELTIAGEGKVEAELKQLAIELNLSDRVHFLGRIEHSMIMSVYQAADLFVLPSLNEGMSNTVMEAMACGLPIVMADIGGAAELLYDGENGFLIQEGSGQSLIEILRRYLRTPSLIHAQGQRSRQLAERMNWKAVSEAYRQIYNDVCLRASS